MMRLLSALGALALAACNAQPAAYTPDVERNFRTACEAQGASSELCACTWDKITRTLTYEEYEAALARFRESGLMDPRVTRARTQCLERHRE